MKINIEWKDIPNFSKYMVSNNGLIKSKERITKVGIKHINSATRKEFIINGFINKKGYKQVTLYDNNGKPKTMRIHRLVAQAFIPNLNNLSQINHKDGNKLNNNVNNLEWCNCLENIKHSWENGLRDNCKRKIVQYDLNENIIKVFNTMTDANNKTNIKIQNIYNCAIGKYKQSGGYIWKYQ